MMIDHTLRVVDLFAGCGGLSLGFDALLDNNGGRVFRTVLAMDNWRPAVEVYRRNHPAAAGAVLPSGRVGDLLWFKHPSEALLYYLAHLSASLPDLKLVEELRHTGYERFLAQLGRVDLDAARSLGEFAASASHSKTIEAVDNNVFLLASCKSALGKLHLSSLRRLEIDRASLPWTEEVNAVSPIVEVRSAADLEWEKYLPAARELWDSVVQQIGSAAAAKGRGQHRGNAEKMRSLLCYFEGAGGDGLRDLWSRWYAHRVHLRSSFCLAAEEQLKKLYTSDRRVSVLLGGPPCKGFSRIGRAVIRELRKQGAHAWSSARFGDERNALMYHYVVFVEALRPDVFLFENVSNFASVLKTPNGELNGPQLLEDLIESVADNELFYNVDAQIFNTKEYGVPQARERYILCGTRSSVPISPRSVLAIRKQSNEVTLGDALSGLPAAAVFKETANDTSYCVHVAEPMRPQDGTATALFFDWIRRDDPRSGRRSAEIDGHIFRKPRKDDERLYRLIAPGIRWMDLKTPRAGTLVTLGNLLDKVEALLMQENHGEIVEQVASARGLVDESLALRLLLEHAAGNLEEPHHLLSDGYLSNGIGKHGDWLERLSATKPCKTIVAHIGKDTYGYIHPFEPRPITIREAARIQTFPDWFSFAGVGVVDAYSMIGNAVPPLLATQFAAGIARGMVEGECADRAGPEGSRSGAQRSLPLTRAAGGKNVSDTFPA